ncbi:MAG: chromosomal replication initiator protein DnaA [Acidobacteria bacterium]|nr:chromosomal replication initiator protein DnaA [Acidobacteriota bacterium]
MNPWERILEQLQKNVSPQNYSTWLKPARFSHVQGTALYVQVPNETFRNWYTQNFSELLQETLRTLALGIDRIELVCPPSGTKSPSPQQAAFDFDAPLAQLNPRYTFETFVVGQSNQFAHAAADAVARNPAKEYNPLFLYGGVGMGKTHLLHAIGHAILSNPLRRLRLCYVTTNQFLHDVINSIRYDRMSSFHDRYRNLDVLLVDDIHFVSSKERTQEEFFHTFNALHEAQKQIVFTSDRPPKEIPQLEERLRSRFEWGLMADIQAPDLETKVAILIRKAEMQGTRLPDDVSLFIASKMHGNIRELEGSLTRLLAYCSLTGTEMSVGTAQQVLKNTLAAQERKVTIEAIQQVVADEFRLRVADLKARNNAKKVVVPRQLAMFLCRELVGASLPEIGRAFGGKHHTTVLHSVEKIREGRKSDRDLNRILNKLTDSLH